MVVDPAEQPFVAPAAEVAKGRAFGRQSLRDQAPGNAPAQHVEDGIQDLAGGPGSRATAQGRLRHERGHHRPLRIRQVCFATKADAAMLPPSSRGPHGTSRSGFSTRLKAPPSRPINPTHPFPDGLSEGPGAFVTASLNVNNLFTVGGALQYVTTDNSSFRTIQGLPSAYPSGEDR